MMVQLRRVPRVSILACASLLFTACTGATGAPGAEGPPGEQGPPGETPGTGITPEPLGLVGRIIEPNLVPVAGGTVYLVPASDVEQLSETSIDIFLSPEATAMSEVDEPIEDLLDANGQSYEQATVDSEGVYRFESLPEGSHFVVWVPQADDTEHLPGGDNSTVAFATDSLIGMQMDIRVSGLPTPAATYVGSSTCMVCHGLHSTERTAHNVGLQVPGVRSILQDIEPWPDFDEGLAAFEVATDLYYFNCSTTPSTPLDSSNCDVTDSDPGAYAFQLNLRRDSSKPLGAPGAYFVDMVGSTTERYDVVLTYGGALERQQYLARRENADGSFSYFVLPLQYNYQGDFANPSPSDWPWRDYRSDLWFDFAGDTLQQPPNTESFDNNCAGCHFTAYSIDGDDADGWSAAALADPNGSFDYDGDGKPELINTGCESCHGPGSEHLEIQPRGGYIVSPGLITPGRQAVLCGSCHSRPLGIGAGMTGLPLSADNEMPPPGIRRADFALNHTTRVGGPPEAFFSSGDPNAAYQQYSDHLRSRHYRNPNRLTNCASCHNPHVNDAEVASMGDPDEPNTRCTTCHSGPDFIDVKNHVVVATGVPAHESLQQIFGPYTCTECHMVPTATGGAAVPALVDPIGGPATVQYYWNDTASHRMTMTPWTGDNQLEQPIAFTNTCGECHAEFLPNNPAP